MIIDNCYVKIDQVYLAILTYYLKLYVIGNRFFTTQNFFNLLFTEHFRCNKGAAIRDVL